MLESRQCILHLPISPRWCFAIVGFGLLFTILFCLTFPEGVDPLPYDHLARAISFRLSQSQQHCPKQTSHSGHSAAPQWRLPDPQVTDRGIYTLENGSYFNVSGFQALPLGWQRLVPLMQKLAKGGIAKIMVFGGSFTLGGGCRQPTATLKKEIIALKDCSWVARLKHWLQKAFPRATLHVENKAQGGSPAQVFLGGLGMYDFSGVDLILLDTLVNDAHERMMFSSDADVHKMDAMDGNFTVSVAFEEMLRSLHELAGPSAAVLALLAGCSPCIATANAHRQVLDFYRVPYLDFARAVETAAYLWVVAPQLLGTPGGTAHPEFQTHQAVADMFALSLTKVWDHMSHMTTEEVKIDQLDLNTAFHPAKYRNKFPRCIHPCSVFSALRKSTVQPKILQGNWTLYEDRPGKPGWISTEPGSVMEVELCFRQTPTFTFTYLRSYEKLGAVRLFLNGRNVTIPGLWTWSAAARVSQSETFFSNAAQNILTGNINQVVGFNVKPYSTLQLRIENLRAHQADNKMKVIEIVSC